MVTNTCAYLGKWLKWFTFILVEKMLNYQLKGLSFAGISRPVIGDHVPRVVCFN